MITKYLNSFLKPIGGRVLSIVVQPDFEKIFKLEVEKKEIEEVATMLQSRPIGCCFRCMLPSYLKDPEQLIATKSKIENEIQKATETPYLASGHAFVCFDSTYRMEYCLHEFKRIGIFDTLYMLCIALKEKCRACFTSSRSRMTSTFGKYIEMDLEAERQIRTGEYSDKMKIEMEPANEPMDINWRNMVEGGLRGIYICRRLFLNIGAILLLIFISTPTL